MEINRPKEGKNNTIEWLWGRHESLKKKIRRQDKGEQGKKRDRGPMWGQVDNWTAESGAGKKKSEGHNQSLKSLQTETGGKIANP